MILNITIDEQLEIARDLHDFDRYTVKIMIDCIERPVILHKDEENNTPICANEFLAYVEWCKNNGKPLLIDWDASGILSKAWINNGNCVGNARKAKCCVDDTNSSVMIRCL